MKPWWTIFYYFRPDNHLCSDNSVLLCYLDLNLVFLTLWNLYHFRVKVVNESLRRTILDNRDTAVTSTGKSLLHNMISYFQDWKINYSSFFLSLKICFYLFVSENKWENGDVQLGEITSLIITF